MITGCVFLMVCFVMIPFTYSSYLLDMDQATFPHSEPMREDSLTLVLLGVQVACSLLAFAIRYPLAYLLYGEIVA